VDNVFNFLFFSLHDGNYFKLQYCNIIMVIILDDILLKIFHSSLIISSLDRKNEGRVVYNLCLFLVVCHQGSL
jgi:hypothetical protein